MIPFSPPKWRRAIVHAGMSTAAFALLACGDERLISPSRPGTAPSFAAGGKKAPTKPTITSVVLSSSSLSIGGDAVSYTVTIQNPGTTNALGISIQAEVDQGSTSRAAGGAQASCGGAAAGVLPPGTCTMTVTAKADNGAQGNGTLIPGNAKLVVMLNQTDGATTTLLDSQTLKVMLVVIHTAPYISNLVPAFSSLVIGGAAADYTVTITNPNATNQSIVLVQATIRQGTNVVAAYGTNVNCLSGQLGVLPPGDCTFTWHTAADLTVAGGNLLVASSAVWRLELIQAVAGGGGSTVLDLRDINITLTNP